MDMTCLRCRFCEAAGSAMQKTRAVELVTAEAPWLSPVRRSSPLKSKVCVKWLRTDKKNSSASPSRVPTVCLDSPGACRKNSATVFGSGSCARSPMDCTCSPEILSLVQKKLNPAHLASWTSDTCRAHEVNQHCKQCVYQGDRWDAAPCDE